MNRPAGVTVSAVVLGVLSLFQIIAGLTMALGALFSHQGVARGGGPLPPWTSLLMWVLCVYCFLVAAWGIATAIGLNRLRRWARYSILIIGGIMAVFAFFAMVGGLVAMLAPQLAAPGSASPQLHSAQTLVRGVLAVVEFIYATICGIGVWWLIYFNRRQVREAFAPASQAEIDQPQQA